MMQNLLAERFGVKIHKESKEVSVYNLVAAKDGPKLKKAEDKPMTFDVPVGPGGPGNTDRRVDGPGGPAAGGASGGSFRTGGPGGPGGPGGGRGPGGPGMVMMRMGGPRQHAR